jgi:hypothetical protein
MQMDPFDCRVMPVDQGRAVGGSVSQERKCFTERRSLHNGLVTDWHYYLVNNGR